MFQKNSGQKDISKMPRKSCPNKEINLEGCTCDWPGCSRKGICCECIEHHRESGDLPACLK